MEKRECSNLETSTDLRSVTSESIRLLIYKKEINIREAIHVQRSIKNMIALAKAQLDENKFLNRKNPVTLLSEAK